MNAYTWQSPDHKRSGVDDMTLLTEISEKAIVENLRKRFMDDWIFTYIGQVLISVNPFKQMKYFTQREIDMYQGAASYENPPHVYALADNMYRNMEIDDENQCVIISGESGAGKTVAAKFIMNYLSQVSGSGEMADKVKNVILKSNPLLEAFGNAKTVRNNNSSRFGKYVEIFFMSGQPIGGKISNFLLEKSRVVTQNPNERNFHIFYQLCSGMDEESKKQFGITEPDYYNYLSMHDCYKVEDTDDNNDYVEMMDAMATMDMSAEEQSEVLQVVAGILHLGNTMFREEGSERSVVETDQLLDFPAFLLQIDKSELGTKLTSRIMESVWGGKTERTDVTLNVQQAETTRDALAKGLYARLFDFLVNKVNEAMVIPSKYKEQKRLGLGILDIYGFEIFQKNGFEQFCINFVNEKLQQIFIELTLKAEQEEYVQEGIAWTPIKYFDNAVVCQLIEEKKPSPGIMAVMDDVCAQLHGVKEGADRTLRDKLSAACGRNKHFQNIGSGFAIHHYAGVVNYDVDGFCERNKDVFNVDLLELMKSSKSSFIQKLFPEQVDRSTKKRPQTSGAKIKQQANALVSSLMQATPHYIRCIKPSETKRPKDWEHDRVKHQVDYLGLKENIRVRRAGFAYRRVFEKFLFRYALLTQETWPRWNGDARRGVEHILKSVNMSQDEFQMGRAKVFIKAPESFLLLEDAREKKFDFHARVIQQSFQKYFNQQKYIREKEDAADIFFQRKERRSHSLNRNFYADYIGLDEKPVLKTLVGKREKVDFAQTVTRYDKKFKGLKTDMRDLVVNVKGIFLVGRSKIDKKTGEGGEPIIARHIPFEQLALISLSTRQDDFVALHVSGSYDSLLQVPFKTEMVSVIKKVASTKGKDVRIAFADKIDFVSEKSRMTGGKKRTINFENGSSNQEVVSTPGFLKNELLVAVGQGMPNTSKPRRDVENSGRKMVQNNNRNREKSTPSGRARKPSINPVRPAPGAPVPGPPSGPAPASQPRGYRPSVRVHRQKSIGQDPPKQPNLDIVAQLKQNAAKKNPSYMRRQESVRESQISANEDFLKTPQGGFAQNARESIRGPVAAAVRPVPAPKPSVKPQPRRPRVKALYDYTAADSDEISIAQGEVLELVKEDESGWWTGKKTDGSQGFIPGAYVEKL